MQLLRDLIRHIRGWDTPSQISLAIALIFLFATILFVVLGSPDLRFPAMVVTVGLVIVTQIIIMWGNRGMISPYTQAQRHYLNGEFEQAKAILEVSTNANRVDFLSLTLLGNTYRQLGDLTKSETVLQQAVKSRPDSHFTAYGLGMTLMVQGRYDDAIVMIRQSLHNGAPSVVKFDLGHCLYRLGDVETARILLADILDVVQHEPHRYLMRAYLLFRMDAGTRPSKEVIKDGIAFWQVSAERYQSTDFGQTLLRDVHEMQQWTEEI